MTPLEQLLVQVDPANAALLLLVYRRLDRRLSSLRAEVEPVLDGEG